MTATCSTCKHWQPRNERQVRTRRLEGWNQCVLVEDVSDPDDYDDALAVGFATTDYEGLCSALLTAPTFGCSRWEAT